MFFKNVIYLEKYHVIKPIPDNEEDTAKNKAESYSLQIAKIESRIKSDRPELKSWFSHSPAT